MTSGCTAELVVLLIVSVRVAEVLAAGVFASAAWTENVDEPPEVGMPLKIPDELRVIPAGSCPVVSFQLYGVVPPDAASVAAYETFAVPFAREVVEITNVDVL